MTYKTHIAKRQGNKINMNVAECGRRLWAQNSKGADIVKTGYFNEIYQLDANNVCQNCLAIARQQGRVK